MKYELSSRKDRTTFAMEVMSRSAQNVMNCYQCGKCSAGCPVDYNMDYQPSEIIRMVQLGMVDTVLDSRAIWLCISCETCTTRCPRENDVARIMDTLRTISGERKQPLNVATGFARRLWSRGLKSALGTDAKSEVMMFNSVFLENVRRHGRSFEASLLSAFNASRGHLFRNLLKGIVMFFKGKVKLYPRSETVAVKTRAIFEKVERWKQKQEP